MKSQKLTEYNPLACITCRETTLSPDNNYDLEKQKINKLISSTNVLDILLQLSTTI